MSATMIAKERHGSEMKIAVRAVARTGSTYKFIYPPDQVSTYGVRLEQGVGECWVYVPVLRHDDLVR